MNIIRNLVRPSPKNVVRIVRLEGTIVSQTRRGPGSLNLRKVEKHLDKAFATKKVRPRAVCLEINSGGGSPVQSNLIFNRIRALSKATKIPVLSFAEDLAASGGYILALAGDEIFVEPNTIIGSIGALSQGFGFQETIKKLGMESRIFTSGEHKVRLDPFSPLKQDDVNYVTNVLKQIHGNFIELVKERRPSLDVKHKTVFSGDFFTGKDAVSFGLADNTCSDLRAVCQARFGRNVKFERCEPPSGVLGRLRNLVTQMKVEVSINDMLEELTLKQYRP